MTEGTVFGTGPYSIDDPELEILKSHQKLMIQRLWSIADKHSISGELALEILSAG
jgi:hypothetical protein